jgi:hypothetical protein
VISTTLKYSQVCTNVRLQNIENPRLANSMFSHGKTRKRHSLAEFLSIRPYPTCCRCRGAPVLELVCPAQYDLRLCTLGSVTLGMTTTFRADGASFLTLVSPPGWYWYGPAPPSCFQGSLPSALETARSEEALVGERAGRRSVQGRRAVMCCQWGAHRNAIQPGQRHHS